LQKTINIKGMVAMNETKEIIIAVIILVSCTILGCMKIITGESITWIIGMIAGYVWGAGKNKIENKNTS